VRLKSDPETLAVQLDEAITQGRNLLNGVEDLSVLKSGYASWDKRNEQILGASFETKGFLAAGPKEDYLSFVGLKYPLLDIAEEVTSENISADLEKKVERLQTVRSNLDVYERTPSSGEQKADQKGEGIFIIHGRDVESRLELENLIHRATDHAPLVLQELANQGATIIEKLEEHLGKSSRFAVVLLTGDDAGLLGEDGGLNKRARQNVILELGFAMAALGGVKAWRQQRWSGGRRRPRVGCASPGICGGSR